MGPRETVGFILFVDVLFVGFAVWMSFMIATEFAYGWLFLLGGLPAWLLVRLVFFSMNGSESGLVTVDRHGVVHVVTGKRSIRRLARMYEQGARRWMWGGVFRGIALSLGGMAGLVIATMLLDSPAPFLLFLTGALWAMLDLVRATYIMLVKPKRAGQEALDGVELLPMLAAYGRHRGWREATNGVPADSLLAVLAEHSADARQLKEYATLHRLLSGVSLSLSRLG